MAATRVVNGYLIGPGVRLPGAELTEVDLAGAFDIGGRFAGGYPANIDHTISGEA